MAIDRDIASTDRPTLDQGDIRRTLLGFSRAKALMSGIELGVFDALAARPLTSQTLAERLQLPESSLRRLLIFLCSLGFLDKAGEAYANSPAATTYLVRGTPEFVGGDIGHLGNNVYLLWNYLSGAIRQDSNRLAQAFPGRDDDPFAAFYRTEEALRAFMDAMSYRTRPVAAELCRVVDFSHFCRLLDVGGATGALLIGVLSQYRHVRGTLFDLPVTASLAQEEIAAARLTDRLEVVSGDMFVDPLPAGADVITLIGILHDWDDEQSLAILRQCYAALEPGGAVIVLEALLDEDGTGPEWAAYLSLTMLVATRGCERSGAEYGALLTRAGFARPEVRRMPNNGRRHAVVAWKDQATV